MSRRAAITSASTAMCRTCTTTPISSWRRPAKLMRRFCRSTASCRAAPPSAAATSVILLSSGSIRPSRAAPRSRIATLPPVARNGRHSGTAWKAGPGIQEHRPLENGFRFEGRGRPGSEIFQAQHAVVVVVSKNFGVPAPIDDRVEDALGLLLRQMVFEFAQKARRRRAMPRPLVKDAPDMDRERHVLEQRLGKDLLAAEHVSLGVPSAGAGQFDV